MENNKTEKANFDREVKEALQGFRAEDRRRCGRLLALLWPYICQFAGRKGRWNEDRKEVFLTHIAEVLPGLLSGYKERSCCFSSWFYPVLSHCWHLLFKARRCALRRVGASPETLATGESGEEEFSPLYGVLERKERFLLQLRYPELLKEGDLMRMHACGFIKQGSIEELRQRIAERRQKQQDIRHRFEDRLSSLYLRKIKAHERGESSTAVSLQKLSTTTERIAARLRRSMVTMSYEEISKTTALPVGTVAGLISRCRTRIRASGQTGARRVS